MNSVETAVRVLIVEDSATQAARLRGLLEEQGFEVGEAHNGHEGTRLFDQDTFHIVLSDISMPELDGFGVCRHVKASPRGHGVPVILLTSMTDPIDIAHGLEAGADNFITKPYAPADLTGAIERALATAAVENGNVPTDHHDRERMVSRLVVALEEAARKGVELEARGTELVATRAKIDDYIRRLRMEHENILKSVGDGIFGVDLAGAITFVNPSAAAVLGWNEEGLVGLTAHRTFIHSRANGSPFPVDESPIHAVLGGQKSYYRAEAVFWTKAGVALPVEHTCTPMENEQHVIVGAVVAFRDIVERRRAEAERVKLEEQFLQSQKMDAVGRLAGGVAHDFNNLLTVIIGFSELLLTGGLKDDGVRKRIGQIQAAAHHAAALTKQLLAFSRRQVIHRSPISLVDAVAGMEQIVKRLVGEDVEVSLNLDAASGHVMGDSNQVGQVLMNLVVNARDAMPHGGNILIEVCDADPRADLDAPRTTKAVPHVMLAVRDTGEGMSAETKARIFEPFFTTKGPGAGTGLGLSTVFGIVEQNEGTISVHSEVGRGTTFKLYFPQFTGALPAVRAPEKRVLAASAGKRTILVVEDKDDVRELVREILDRAGFRVLLAANPAEALVLFEVPDRRVDLLLTDMVMPGMTGRELAAKLVAQAPGLRVLFMSGYTARVADASDMVLSPEAFLQKPFSPQVLIDKVREMMQP